MRNVFLHFAITLDGMVSNVEQWVSLTDEAMKDGSAFHDTVDAIIFGHNNYAPLAAYWQQAETSANSVEERAFAKKINDMPKFVLAHGEVDLVWRNSSCCVRKIVQPLSKRLHGSSRCRVKILP